MLLLGDSSSTLIRPSRTSFASKDFLQSLPPSLRVSTSRASLHQALLHAVRHLPPSLNLGIGSHLLHIGIVIGSRPLHRSEERHGTFVEKDRIVADVAVLDLLQNRWPYVFVAFLVLAKLFWLNANDLCYAASLWHCNVGICLDDGVKVRVESEILSWCVAVSEEIMLKEVMKLCMSASAHECCSVRHCTENCRCAS